MPTNGITVDATYNYYSTMRFLGQVATVPLFGPAPVCGGAITDPFQWTYGG